MLQIGRSIGTTLAHSRMAAGRDVARALGSCVEDAGGENTLVRWFPFRKPPGLLCHLSPSDIGVDHGLNQGRHGHPTDFLQLLVKSSSLANWNGLSVLIPNLLATSGILRFARLFLGLETSVVTIRRPAGFTSA